MRIHALIQARTGSKRLPNKVIKLLNGNSIIEHLHSRMRASKMFSKIVVLTSDKNKDNKIVNLCKKNKIKFFRGSEENVGLRFFEYVKKNDMDFFLRVNADSPLLDFNLIKDKIKYLNDFHIVTNCLKKTYPKGQSFEFVSKNIFIKTFGNFKKKKHFEHVTNYFYENKKKFKIFNFELQKNLNKKFNFCIDTLEDLKRIRKIFKKINKQNLNDIKLNNLLKIYEN